MCLAVSVTVYMRVNTPTLTIEWLFAVASAENVLLIRIANDENRERGEEGWVPQLHTIHDGLIIQTKN